MARNTTYTCACCKRNTKSARPIQGYILCDACHRLLIAVKELSFTVSQIVKLKIK